MKIDPLFSSPAQLEQLAHILYNYLRLPFSEDVIPGSLMEATLARVHSGNVLRTYEAVDVISSQGKIGWQVKSTKSITTVTWKHVKDFPDKNTLVAESEVSDLGRKLLGEAIICNCNDSVLASMHKYNLDSIGYARLILMPDKTMRYFERLLLDKENPQLFNPDDYEWNWSQKKEKLTSFFATHIVDKKVHFRWHGRGENQLHFMGERTWWPTDSAAAHQFSSPMPTEARRIKFETLALWLAQLP